MQQVKVSGRQNTVSEIKCYVETATERPTFWATFTLVHGIAIPVFVQFSDKFSIVIVIQK